MIYKSCSVRVLLCHFHTKCYYTTAGLLLLLWFQSAHFFATYSSTGLKKTQFSQNKKKSKNTPRSSFIFRFPCILVAVLCKSRPSSHSLPLQYHWQAEVRQFLKKTWQENTQQAISHTLSSAASR